MKIFNQAILTIIQKALNKLLSLDPHAYAQAVALNNKVVAIEETFFGINFYLIFTEHDIQIKDHHAGVSDTTIRGKLFKLMQLTRLFDANHKPVLSGAVAINGDVELGQRIQMIFSNLDIDWEEQLSHFTGDVIAHQLGNFTRRIWRITKHNTQSMQENVTEYLQEEIRYLPPRLEIEDFFHDVDALRNDVERIAARIDRLNNM